MMHPKRPSQVWARRYLAQLEPALQSVREGTHPSLTAVVWPGGLDRSLLPEMGLTVRVWNCLNQARLVSGHSPLVADALLRIPNFGRSSLVDLVLAVEKYLVDCTLVLGNPESEGASSDTSTAAAETPTSSVASLDLLGTSSERWSLATEGLRSLLATSADVLGTPTLADALRPDLVRLASKMGIGDSLRSVALHEAMLGTTSLPVIVSRRLGKTLNSFTERERAVVQTRLVQVPPATLEEVGVRIGVTRERTRQIQAKLKPKIEQALGAELSVIASTLREHLDPLVPADELERRIDQIIPDPSGTVTTIFRNALTHAMGFTLNDGVYINEQAAQVIRSLRSHARELADDAGLVQELDLLGDLPDKKWHRFWPWLRRRSALHSFHGSLALRDSAKARTKAALLSIGRPATKEEIGALCGFDPKQVGSYLSNVPSVVRADPERFGLRDWVEDEYDGIVGEIIQRIEEDGGVTTTERLLREIPSKFNVSPVSVQLYMRTPRFEIRNGSISLASPSSIRLRNLDDVVHGHDEGGAPFWTFLVEDRYFQGYSVVGIPPEFAKALGCAPDSGVDIGLENLPNCRALSLNWRLSSVTGASLGHVAEPLRLLGLETGDRARVTIAASRSLRLSLDVDNTERPSQGADATLARMLERRRAI